jgi:hypothetical protein
MPLLDDIKETGTNCPPPIVTVHGPAGSRKTQLAIDAKALILQTEDGIGPRKAKALKIKTLADFYAVITEIATTDNGFPAVALDSLDHFAPIVAQAVCDAHGKPNIEAFGFGKGYDAEAEEWRKIFDYLERLRNRKRIPIILIAHQAVRSVNDPTQSEPYDRYEPKLNKKVNAIVKELSDVLGCVTQVMHAKENDRGQTRMVGAGDFQLHVSQRPAYEAKNRYAINHPLPMTWDGIMAAINKGINP